MKKSSDNARPRLLVASQARPGSRELSKLREQIRSGHARDIWEMLTEKVERERVESPWTPSTPLPGRRAAAVEIANREFELVGMTLNRFMDAALVALVRDCAETAHAAFRQVEAILDPAQWPDIDDQAHLRKSCCGLRRGQFAGAFGLAYDWIAPLLEPGQREAWVEGFRTRLLGPFQHSVARSEHFVRGDSHNFTSVMYGGYAIAAMGFAEDLPEAEREWIVEVSRRAMDAYAADIVGPEGEFFESVGYAGSVYGVLRYLAVRRSAEGADDSLYREARLDAFGYWYAHCTLPPGRVIGFGDTGLTNPAKAAVFAHLASALRDPVLQGFYFQYADTVQPYHRNLAEELLDYDPALEPRGPEDGMPLGRRFSAGAQIVVSRSDWDPHAPRSIAYAKAGFEPVHAHADCGQVCFDGRGERLLVDIGLAPGAYPDLARSLYYNYQQIAHNVLVAGEVGELGGSYGAPPCRRDENRTLPHGRIAHAAFDEMLGGAWSMDLSAVYGFSVWRHVAHLLPDVLVVLDEANAETERSFRLHWHPGAEPEWDAAGHISARVGAAALCGRVGRLDGEAAVRLDHHRYEPPYHKDRDGGTYPQRHEPYLELLATDRTCRFFGLFAASDDTGPAWEETGDGWRIGLPSGTVRVSPEADGLRVFHENSGQGWRLAAKPQSL